MTVASALPTIPGLGSPNDPLAFRPNPAVYGQNSSFDGVPAIGALFHTDDSGNLEDHFCTATVVNSPYGNLVITAAHCLGGRSRAGNLDVDFAPGYHDGVYPYGLWKATRFMADAQWDGVVNPLFNPHPKGDPNAKGDDDNDFAFLQLVAADGSNSQVQRKTGAAGLVFDTPSSGVVQVRGYPNTTEKPVTCQNKLTDSHIPHQLEFDCPGYLDGTSGSAFATPAGAIMGVIGGYEQGGDLPQVSYSSTFDDNTRLLYTAAMSATPSPQQGKVTGTLAN